MKTTILVLLASLIGPVAAQGRGRGDRQGGFQGQQGGFQGQQGGFQGPQGGFPGPGRGRGRGRGQQTPSRGRGGGRFKRPDNIEFTRLSGRPFNSTARGFMKLVYFENNDTMAFDVKLNLPEESTVISGALYFASEEEDETPELIEVLFSGDDLEEIDVSDFEKDDEEDEDDTENEGSPILFGRGRDGNKGRGRSGFRGRGRGRRGDFGGGIGKFENRTFLSGEGENFDMEEDLWEDIQEGNVFVLVTTEEFPDGALRGGFARGGGFKN